MGATLCQKQFQCNHYFHVFTCKAKQGDFSLQRFNVIQYDCYSYFQFALKKMVPNEYPYQWMSLSLIPSSLNKLHVSCNCTQPAMQLWFRPSNDSKANTTRDDIFSYPAVISLFVIMSGLLVCLSCSLQNREYSIVSILISFYITMLYDSAILFSRCPNGGSFVIGRFSKTKTKPVCPCWGGGGVCSGRVFKWTVRKEVD